MQNGTRTSARGKDAFPAPAVANAVKARNGTTGTAKRGGIDVQTPSGGAIGDSGPRLVPGSAWGNRGNASRQAAPPPVTDTVVTDNDGELHVTRDSGCYDCCSSSDAPDPVAETTCAQSMEDAVGASHQEPLAEPLNPSTMADRPPDLPQEDLDLLSQVAQEEKAVWAKLLKLVIQEANSGTARTRWSILRRIAAMQTQDLDNLIELYEASHRCPKMPEKPTAEDENSPPPPGLGQPGILQVETTSPNIGRQLPPQPSWPAPSPPGAIAEMVPPSVGVPPAQELQGEWKSQEANVGHPLAAAPPPKSPPIVDLPTLVPTLPTCTPPPLAPPGSALLGPMPPVAPPPAPPGVQTLSTNTSTSIETDPAVQTPSTDPTTGIEPAPAVVSTPSTDPTTGIEPAPAVVSPPRETAPTPKIQVERLSGDRLSDWLRRRVFELRVPLSDVGMGATELLSVLQSLGDEQLAPPFSEVKMWIGLDEKEDLHPALAQLVSEFASTRMPAE